MEFEQRFKETTPQNHPSALHPSSNRRLRQQDHKHLSPAASLKLMFMRLDLGSAWLVDTHVPDLLASLSRFELRLKFSSTSRHRFEDLSSLFPPKCWPGCTPETRLWHFQFQTASVVPPQTPVGLMGSEDDGRGGWVWGLTIISSLGPQNPLSSGSATTGTRRIQQRLWFTGTQRGAIFCTTNNTTTDATKGNNGYNKFNNRYDAEYNCRSNNKYYNRYNEKYNDRYNCGCNNMCNNGYINCYSNVYYAVLQNGYTMGTTCTTGTTGSTIGATKDYYTTAGTVTGKATEAAVWQHGLMIIILITTTTTATTTTTTTILTTTTTATTWTTTWISNISARSATSV